MHSCSPRPRKATQHLVCVGRYRRATGAGKLHAGADRELEANGSPFHASREVIVQPGRYKTTTLHVAEKYVQPDAATLQRIAADKAVKDTAFAHLISRPLWKGSFRSPVPFTPTDSFGTRRMFNGTLASIHRGNGLPRAFWNASGGCE